jgi:glycosyltransferase involved in cell wall biosynthesis
MTPLVTVIVPTFNRRTTIITALESALRQDFPSFEVIIVDDASTDGTADFLRSQSYSVPVCVVQQSENRGPAAARNLAISRASGKYIAFLDSDDQWLPEKLAKQVAAMEQCTNPDKVLLYSRTRVLQRGRSIVRPTAPIADGEDPADYLFLNQGYIPVPAVMVTTKMARQTPFQPQLRLHEDWDWYIRLWQTGVRFVMLPEVLSVIDDRASHNRASDPRPERSFSVLENWRSVISHRAYLARRAQVAPQLRKTRPFDALRFVLEAYVAGALSTWSLFVLIGRLAHPRLSEIACWIRDAVNRPAALAAICLLPL